MENEVDVFKFGVGKVIVRSFGVLFRNIIPFGILTLILIGIQFGIQFLIFGEALLNPEKIASVKLPTATVFIAIMILNILIYYMVQASLVFGSISDLRGSRAGMVECVSKGLRYLIPVILVGFSVGIIFIVSSVALLIPGLIFFTMLWVAIPVSIVESHGVKSSIARSMELTKGHRWKIFAIIIIAFMGAGIVSQLTTVLAANVLPLEGVIAVTILGNAFVIAYSSVVSAVSYHDLRVVKEGVSAEEIAAVFD